MAILAGTPAESTSVAQLTYRRSALAEWPTWLVWAAHYGVFGALTFYWQHVPSWVLIPVLAYIICLHAHLTHEVIHGHPTRNRTFNRLLVLLNLTAWVPYEHYRDHHIAHHKVDHLTHPEKDPESYYFTPDAWAGFSAPTRWLLTANYSFLGRMILGPILVVGGFWRDESWKLLKGDTAYLLPWVGLILNNAVLVYWLIEVCAMPVVTAALSFYFGVSLMLFRSFSEHRPGVSQEHRCTIVEGGPVMQLLFLNNCFHLIHHDRPDLPWYEIPRVYATDKAGWRDRTGGFWFTGYWEIVKRTAFKPKDSPLFPADQA